MIRRIERPCLEKALALLLAGVILSLAPVVVLDHLQHLSGAVPASHNCPVCAWAHAVLAGVTVWLALLWAFLQLGLSAPMRLVPLAIDFLPSNTSRAPPAPTSARS